jgi:hypothetical protein
MTEPAEAVVLALASIQGFSSQERALVLRSFAPGRRSGRRPWDEFFATAPALGDHAFTWPEFDRWQAFFRARGSFPVRWEGLQQVPAASTAAADDYRRRKLGLLLEWLDALARRSSVIAHYARRGLGTRIAQQDARDACAVCTLLVARPEGVSPDLMPPFHPGCRCLLLAAPAPGGRPRARRPAGRLPAS